MVEDMLASQEGLCSVDFVSWSSSCNMHYKMFVILESDDKTANVRVT